MRRTALLNFIFLACLLFAGFAHAHHPDGQDSPVRFVENRGQWEDQVLFAADLPSGRVFVERDRLSYVFCDVSDLHERYFHRKTDQFEGYQMDCHAFTVRFDGARIPDLIRGEHKVPQYHNYYQGKDPGKWAAAVPLFEGVRYQNIYPGIDFVIYGRDKGLKYDFVVQPGADASRIQMTYDGLDALEMFKGGLQMKTSLLDIEEEPPYAFDERDQEVRCTFRLEGNSVQFEFPEGYRKDGQLTIDPQMIFSTYTGSFANNFGFTATYDLNGNLYAGGIAYGQGYPVTTGAYQTQFGGGSFDMSFTKFDAGGAHLYSTYVGGSGEDQPHSMIADDFGNLYAMGRTNSSDFPTPAGAYDPSYNGDYDVVVVKLNPSGSQLLGATYVGGSLSDGLNMTGGWIQSSIKYNYGDDARGEVVLDDNGDVYVAACTQSLNFPVTAGALQGTLGSQQDGCVFKLSNDLSNLVWSTYLGGTDDDAAYSLKTDRNGNVFVTGGTRSSDFPTTTGTLNPSQPGGIDGFIVHINTTGTALVSGTYIGTSDYNQTYFIELDRDEDVYVVGQKHGAWTVTPGVWSTPSGGQFIMKITNDLSSVIYSTQFGTSNAAVNISPTAFLVDVCEYVYVSGWGGTTNFEGTTSSLPMSGNALQTTTDGSDLYIIVLEEDAQSLFFSTYVGGNLSNEHVDGGTSRFNKKSEVYQSVCAGCWANSDFPTTPGAFSPNNNSSGCNLACFKMEIQAPGVVADFIPVPDSGGCAPHAVYFDNESVGGNTYIWNFGDPPSGAQNTSTATNPSHTYNTAGIFTVMLVAIDSNSCNIVDTAYRQIQVYPVPVATITPDTAICLGESVNLTAAGGLYYAWNATPGLSSTNTPSTTATPTQNTTYTVVVANPGGCRDTVDVTIDVLPIPTADAGTGGYICPGDSLQLSGAGGQSFAWSPSGSVDNSNVADPFAFPVQTTTYTLTVTAANGCEDEDTVTVQVSAVRALPGPNVDLCIGASVELSASGGGSYAWAPPTYLSATNVANPTVNNPGIGPITYGLTVTDAGGCSHTDSITIVVHALPIVNAGPDQIVLCELDSVQLVATGANSYAWNPPVNLSNPNSGTTYAFPGNTTQYIVLGTDQWGCEDTDTIQVQVLPAPVATAWNDGTICADSSIQVFASGGVTYSWSPASAFDDPNAPDPTATLSQTTSLVVTVMGANGCDNRDTVLISVTPTPAVEGVGDRTICQGDRVNLIARGGEPYFWSTGETGFRIQVSPDSSTYYTVWTMSEGCPSRPDTVWVTVDDTLPIANFYADPDSGFVPHTVTFINQSQDATSWIWDFDDGRSSTFFSPTYTYTDSGHFEVMLIAIDENGCRDTAYQKVIVGADFTIWVPNIFTPNGDGLNDYFSTPWIGVEEFNILIFDRWGMLIFQSRDPNFKWDGFFQGQGCQEGAYTYVIEASGYLGEKQKKAGTVTLAR